MSVEHMKTEFLWATPKDVELKVTKEFTTDDPSKIGTGAIKYDGGKPSLWRGVFEYFPRAVEAVGQISTFGASKYAWKGWESVPDGYNRYSDALGRHLLREGIDGPYDVTDSNLLHAAQVAWNALARLELELKKGTALVNPDRASK